MQKEQIINIKNQAISNILEAKTKKDLETLRISYLGRKGQFNQLLKEIPKLPADQRGEFGKSVNENKRAIEEALKDKLLKLKDEPSRNKFFDITIPGDKPEIGHTHLISQTIEEVTEILKKIGFTYVSYPEVEWDWFSFEGLNMPKEHPARDEWETFFIENLTSDKYGKAVLTPHTSNGQLREMMTRKPPIRMVNIGKCYRRQVDVSHAPMFYQFEGLLIDKGINITHLKGTLDYFVKQYFGKDRQTRIRPFHFQFTEPSFEIDVTCIICKGKGCKVCKQGWLEIGGAGMVHPEVLKNGGIDPKEYSGFAWGWGIERLMMMKHSIPDIRLLFNGDLKFLKQF